MLWYNDDELNKLKNIEEIINGVLNNLKNKCDNDREQINNKYHKYLRYFQKKYWQELKKNQMLYSKSTNISYHLLFFSKTNIYLQEIMKKYLKFGELDVYGKILTQEKYVEFYESYITIRNILTNIPTENLIIESYRIEQLLISINEKMFNNNDLKDINNIDDKYYNSSWYEVIKDYNNILEIYNEAFQNSWPYERFYDITNAYKLFKKIKQEEEAKRINKINQENQDMSELPNYLLLKNPNLISLFDKDSLQKIRNDLITRLVLLNEEEQNQTINCLYQLTKK